MFSNINPKFEIMPENFDYIIEGDSKGYEKNWSGGGDTI